MSLHLIKDTLEQVAKAIQAALGVHVTIADANHVKLVSTIGDSGTIDQGSANAISIQEQRLIFISNPREHEACLLCGNKGKCLEFAEVCAPIVYRDAAIGVIGLVAYTEAERSLLLAREQGVKAFLEQMSGLIVSKLREADDQQALKQAHVALSAAHGELDLLFDNLQRGVVYCDNSGTVLRYNAMANRMMDFQGNTKLPRSFFEGDLDKNLFNQSFSWPSTPIRRGLFDRHPLLLSGNAGFVFFVESLGEAIERYHALEAQPLQFSFDDISGASRSIQGVISLAMKASRTTSTVLIQGESGTGKEVFARAIHHASARSSKAFVAINCGAIPENLLESELFGYEAGAFSGASKSGKPGKFELAHGGTLFLDEIGEMPLNLQVKILRVIQERSVERIGGQSATPIDVRIICATHRDLEKMVAEGEFREDLYYRIQVLPLVLPPLRERQEDFPHILEKLVRSKVEKLKIAHEVSISESVIRVFMNHRWPGNIRELENVIEYALNLDTDGIIDLGDLPNRFFVSSGRRASDRQFQTIESAEKELILAALAHFGRDRLGVAKICEVLGISRATLYRKLKHYQLLED